MKEKTKLDEWYDLRFTLTIIDRLAALLTLVVGAISQNTLATTIGIALYIVAWIRVCYLTRAATKRERARIRTREDVHYGSK